MVKLGFIVEGDTEKILLESKAFKNFLNELQINYVPEVINAKTQSMLLPNKREEFTEILRDKGATKIVILTDQDKDSCISQTKARICPDENQICIIAKKEIESWFLADNLAMAQFLGLTTFSYLNPELPESPIKEIKELRLQYQNKGVSDKKIFAKLILNKNNFSLRRAAAHPNCSSAKYFIDKLIQLSNQN